MSTKIAVRGLVLKAAATAAPTVVVPGVEEVSMSGGQREMIDTTTHDDTVVKSQIPSPIRAQRKLEVTLLYDPANTQHERMRAAHAAGTLEYQSLILPDAGAAQYDFSGYIVEWNPLPMGQDGALKIKYMYEVVAAEVFTQ